MIENKKCWNVCFQFLRISIFLHPIDSILRLHRKKDHRHRIKPTSSDFSSFLHRTVAFSGFLRFGFLLINTCPVHIQIIQFLTKQTNKYSNYNMTGRSHVFTHPYLLMSTFMQYILLDDFQLFITLGVLSQNRTGDL